MSETKCLVCKNIYDAGKCPWCGFPRMAVVGDYNEGVAKLREAADIYRREYLADIQLGLIVSKWKEKEGKLELDYTEVFPLAKGDELLAGEKWCQEKFARIPDQKILEVLLVIKKAGMQRNITVQIPNLMKAELQQIGVRRTKELEIVLMLRNDSETSVSEVVSLLERS